MSPKDILEVMQKVNTVMTFVENVGSLQGFEKVAVQTVLAYLNDIQGFLIPMLEQAHADLVDDPEEPDWIHCCRRCCSELGCNSHPPGL